LRDRFIARGARTDEISRSCRRLNLVQAIVWRHPFIFYVGHLPAFSWNQICVPYLNESFNPCFDDLFWRRIDPDIDTGECHWHPTSRAMPSFGDVVAYRDNVRGAILDSLEAIAPAVSKTDVMAQRGRVFHMATRA